MYADEMLLEAVYDALEAAAVAEARYDWIDLLALEAESEAEWAATEAADEAEEASEEAEDEAYEAAEVADLDADEADAFNAGLSTDLEAAEAAEEATEESEDEME
jgi:hypothetical protein